MPAPGLAKPLKLAGTVFSAKRLLVGTMGLALASVLQVSADQADTVGVAVGVVAVARWPGRQLAMLLMASPVWQDPQPGSLAQGTRLVRSAPAGNGCGGADVGGEVVADLGQLAVAVLTDHAAVGHGPAHALGVGAGVALVAGLLEHGLAGGLVAGQPGGGAVGGGRGHGREQRGLLACAICRTRELLCWIRCTRPLAAASGLAASPPKGPNWARSSAGV